MGEDDKLIDQTQLAEDVSKKIKWDFKDSFLVKPLEPIMVKKEFSKLPEQKPATEDENGIEAVDIEDGDVQTEVKEVESDFHRGIVLKVPFDYQLNMDNDKYPSMPIKVGDVIIWKTGPYNKTVWFDLLKDAQLVKSFDIIGIEHCGD